LARLRRDVQEMSADDLVAVLWHQHRIKSFRKIARLTRHQIINILSRKVDPETGLVELWGTPEARKLRKQEEERQRLADLPCDYPGVFRYVWRHRLAAQGLPPDEVEREVERRWLETPIGKEQAAYQKREARHDSGSA
jgi:hypothetical protein